MSAFSRAGATTLLVLLAATAAVFLPGLSGGFLFDDFHNIVTNPRIHLERWDIASIERATQAYRSGAYGRPLATLTLAFDYWRGGKEAHAFKVTNLLIHLLNTGLIFALTSRLARATFAAGSDAGRVSWFAFAAALLWAVHPLQISTVLYVVQRMEMLAATFMLLAVLAWTKGRMRQLAGAPGLPWLVGAAVLATIGLLSKESSVAAALFVVALELAVFRFAAADAVVSRRLKLVFAVAAVAAVAVFAVVIVPRYASAESFAGRDFTMGERLLTQLRVLPFYLGQVLLPLPAKMTFYYDDFAISTGLFSPWTTAAGAALLAALLVLAWRIRERMPLVALGILWFFAGHVLTSGPVNLELVFEHRNYLPLFGIALALAELGRRAPMRDGLRLKVAAIATALVLVAALGAIRAATWGNPLLLAADLAAKNPASARASSDLATLYFALARNDPGSRFFQLAETEFERGSRLPSASPLPENGLILMAASVGRPAKDEWWDRLIRKVETQPIGTQQIVSVTGLMTQYREGFPVDKAKIGEAMTVLLRRQPFPGWMYANFADFALAELGDEALADEMFVRAVAADPDDIAFARRVLGNLVAEGRTRQANAVQRRLRELGTFERVLAADDGAP